MSYTVGPMPQTKSLEEFMLAVWDELSKIDAGDHELALEEVHIPVPKPRNGQIAFADGTDWDPGAGRGVYYWDEGAMLWKLMG